MPRINSQIAEEFAAVLDKLAYPNMQSYEDDPEARAGSDSISSIEMLYNVKPRQDLINEYEQTIMEAAHPNSVVIAPSYDRINGLVENNIERQNIMRNIVNKVPTGNHTGFKYAKHELTMELVRLANEMDVQNQDKLFKLADECLFELNQEGIENLKKQAIAPLLIAGIVGVVLGATWLLGHTADTDNGPLANTERAIAALRDLATNSFWESDVDATVQNDAGVLIKHLEALKAAITEFNKVQSFATRPRTLKDSTEIAKLISVAKEHGDFIAEAVDKFKASVDEIMPELEQSLANFSSNDYRNTHIKPSFIADMSGAVGDLFHGKNGLIADDFTSAVNALKPLMQSLSETKNKLSNFETMAQKYADKVKEPVEKMETASMQSDPDALDKEYDELAQSVKIPGSHYEGNAELPKN